MAARFASWDRRYPVDPADAGACAARERMRAGADALEAAVCARAGVRPEDVRRLRWTGPRARRGPRRAAAARPRAARTGGPRRARAGRDRHGDDARHPRHRRRRVRDRARGAALRRGGRGPGVAPHRARRRGLAAGGARGGARRDGPRVRRDRIALRRRGAGHRRGRAGPAPDRTPRAARCSTRSGWSRTATSSRSSRWRTSSGKPRAGAAALDKAVKAVGGQVRSVRLPADLERWIAETAPGMGVRLGRGAARELAQRLGGQERTRDVDRRGLAAEAAAELAKLGLYREDAEVSVEDVRALVAERLPASVFDLLDAIGARRAQQAIRLLERASASVPGPVLVVRHPPAPAGAGDRRGPRRRRGEAEGDREGARVEGRAVHARLAGREPPATGAPPGRARRSPRRSTGCSRWTRR